MSEAAPPNKPQLAQVQRLFEQGPDATSFYSDFSQVINTGNELVFQFYETIPGPPGPGGQVQSVRTRLRTTITMSFTMAKNLANNVLAQLSVTPPPAQTGERK